MRIGSKKANYVDANTMYSEIGLYVPTITADGQGGYITTYALQETVFGDFRPMDESRKLMDAQITYTRAAKLFVRYDVTITNNYNKKLKIKKKKHRKENSVKKKNKNKLFIYNAIISC
jgi:head-tail adaptor